MSQAVFLFTQSVLLAGFLSNICNSEMPICNSTYFLNQVDPAHHIRWPNFHADKSWGWSHARQSFTCHPHHRTPEPWYQKQGN